MFILLVSDDIKLCKKQLFKKNPLRTKRKWEKQLLKL